MVFRTIHNIYTSPFQAFDFLYIPCLVTKSAFLPLFSTKPNLL